MRLKKMVVISIVTLFLLNESYWSQSEPSHSDQKEKDNYSNYQKQNEMPIILEKESADSSSNSHKTIKKVLLLTLTIVAAGVVSYFLLKKKNKKSEEAEPTIYSQGQFQIHGTWGCDLDQGKETLVKDTVTDFKWDQETSIKRYILPKNGAKFYVIGKVDFNTIKYSNLKSYTYSSEKINGSNDSSNQIPQGTVIAAITNEERYCKFKIDTYGVLLTISYLTYNKQ